MGTESEFSSAVRRNDLVVAEAVGIVSEATARSFALRLCGGTAVWFRAGESSRSFLAGHGRSLPDIDLVCRSRHRRDAEALLSRWGFRLDNTVLGSGPYSGRLVYRSAVYSNTVKECELYLDELRFSHCVDLRGRLEVDNTTIPLAELLLSKLQIERISQRDLMDCVALLADHRIASEDDQCVNIAVLSSAWGSDWGLWRTTMDNIARLRACYTSNSGAGVSDADLVARRIEELAEILNLCRKTLGWKIRAQIGDLVPWCEEVEDRTDDGGPE